MAPGIDRVLPGRDVRGDVLEQAGVGLLRPWSPPPHDWNRSGSVAGLQSRRELGLERLVLEDGDVDLDVRVRRRVGVGDGLEVGLAGVAGGDVPPVDRRPARRRRGGAAPSGGGRRCGRGRGCGRRGRGGRWRSCATASRAGGRPPAQWLPDSRHMRQRVDTTRPPPVGSPPEDSILAATWRSLRHRRRPVDAVFGSRVTSWRDVSKSVESSIDGTVRRSRLQAPIGQPRVRPSAPRRLDRVIGCDSPPESFVILRRW